MIFGFSGAAKVAKSVILAALYFVRKNTENERFVARTYVSLLLTQVAAGL
ncbi:MAG: hypothetical protein HDR04_01470 [Lachnospiraceae bacterium]|nr:hypothetical protein [Lachnospiraceae bacterium]